MKIRAEVEAAIMDFGEVLRAKLAEWRCGSCGRGGVYSVARGSCTVFLCKNSGLCQEREMEECKTGLSIDAGRMQACLVSTFLLGEHCLLRCVTGVCNRL